MTGIKRRQFIHLATKSLVATALIPLATGSKSLVFGAPLIDKERPLLLSACDDQQGQHWISAWHSNGEQKFKLPIPQRAHDVSYCAKSQLAIFFSRRPGNAMYVVSLATGELLNVVKSQDGYHFYGHGVFSADGKRLYATENDYHRRRGIIGVYDTDNFQRVAELESGGIGPHQLAFMNDGETLVVANGGILTHPDRGREKLNIDTMQSSLCYVDSKTGMAVDRFLPQDPQMSIRHLAVSCHNQVIMGVQYQGEKSAMLPLVLSHLGEESLQPMQADELTWLGQNQYIASVAIDTAGTTAVTTSPRGNSVLIWDIANNKHINTVPINDVAGAVYSPTQHKFVTSNGSGQLITIDGKTGQTDRLFSNNLRWDNHLNLVG